MYTRFGKIHQDRLAIIERLEDNYKNVQFDAIIGATSYVDKEGLYIEDKLECLYKREVYKLLQGPRILLLTMFEFQIPASAEKYKYADVSDFDYIIVPLEKYTKALRAQLDVFSFENIIKYYTYDIFKNTKSTM